MKNALSSLSKRIGKVSPIRMIAISFLLIIVVGSILLALPISSKGGIGIDLIDAIFTSTSATCVTGLVVCDTYMQFTVFGQVVIMLLIQCGGLGLITFSSGLSLLIRRKLDFKEARLAKEYTSGNTMELSRLIKTILCFTFISELVGALLLMIRFVPLFGGQGVFISVFFAVSAFCNAGFDIIGFMQPFGNLAPFSDDPLVILVISCLIIIGGIGFIVVAEICEYIKKRKRGSHRSLHLSIHSAVVISTTAVLLIAGSVLVFLFEHNNAFSDMSVGEKLLQSFFQSTTARTAGFSAINQDLLSVPTKITTIALMFIGASPCSTGGGIKTTTFIVIVCTVISVLRGKNETLINRRRIDKAVVYRAITIATLGALIIALTSNIIYLSSGDEIPMLSAVYEATSAFGTVGVSTGITPDLNIISKWALIVTMFIGRVGPVSLIWALTTRHKNRANIILPEGKILVG